MKSKEDKELLDTMVDATCQDIKYQFNLDHDSQVIKLIRDSLERLEKEQ